MIERKQLVKLDGEYVDLNFHSGQAQAWNSMKRFTFMIAGTQGGKTAFGPLWLHREIYDDDIGRGAGDYLAVTASYDLFKLKMLPAMREYFESTLRLGRYWAGDKIIELRDPETGEFWAERQDDPMWGRVILRSARSGGGLESATAKAAWLDECGMDEFTAQTWQAVLRRLSLHRGRVLGTTTLYVLFNWLKQLYEDWIERRRDDLAFIQFASVVNPSFPQEEFEQAIETLPEHVVNMFYRGQYDKPPGMIYDAFDDRLCIVPPFNLSDTKHTVYGGIDFGGVNTAAVRVVHDHDKDRFIITNEYHAGGKAIKDHAATLKQWHCEFWYGGANSEGQWREEYATHGMPIQKPLISDVWLGINRIYGLHKQNKILIFETCEGVQKELGSYARKIDQRTGEPGEEIANKNAYHLLDAKRYPFTYLARDIKASAPNSQPEEPSKWRDVGARTKTKRRGRWKVYT